MDFRQLECFIKVVEYHNFTHAAKEMHYSVSTVTQSVHALEGELGFELFNPASRPLSLTDAGYFFYEKVAQMPEQMKYIISQSQSIASNRAEKITVAFCPEDSLFIPLIRRHFMDSSNSPILVLRQIPSHQLAAALSKRECDYIFCRQTAACGSLPFTPLMTVRYGCRLPSSHCLASRPQLSLSDFSQETIVMFRCGTMEERRDFLALVKAHCPSITIIDAVNFLQADKLSREHGYPLVCYEHLYKTEYTEEYCFPAFEPQYTSIYGLISH